MKRPVRRGMGTDYNLVLH